MTLGRLRLITILLPIAFLLLVESTAMLVLMRHLRIAYGHLVAIPVMVAGIVVFSTVVFRMVASLQERIVRQNQELSALNAVAGAVSGPLDLKEVVASALGNVMEVTGASAGEIVVTAREPREHPLRLSHGATDALKLLNRLWESDWGHSDGFSVIAGVWIVDLERPQLPAAAEARQRGFRTAAWVPLRAQDRLLGVMKLLAGESSHLTSEGSEPLLAATGSQIAVAIQGGHLFQDVLRRGKEAQALYEIGLGIASLQDIEEILRSVVEQARELVGSDTAALCRLRENGGGLAVASSAGPDEALRGSPVSVPILPTTPATADGYSSMPKTDTPCSMLTEGYRASHLSAPLVVGGSMIGELCVASGAAQRFSGRDQEFLASLADMAAIAINHARVLEDGRYLAVLEERERLSREMHDSLAQVLGYLHLKARAASRSLSRQDVPKTEEELNDMASLAHEAYLDVREAILALRQSLSSAMGIIGTLREYLEKFERQAAIKVELEVDEDNAPQLSSEIEVQLLRVIQEALTNVRKHANATTARIRIGQEGADVTVSIEDDGQGFDPALAQGGAGRAFGVRIMRERIEKVGGRFEIESRPGCGTTVRIAFPLGRDYDNGTS